MSTSLLETSDPIEEYLPLSVSDFRPKRSGKQFDDPVHPPWFGLTLAHLLSRSFDCQFELSEDDINSETPLYLYIEKLVFATELPFKVTVASFILLQRIYTRLPPDVFAVRARLSPHRLFAAAYIISAKQYTQLQLGLDISSLISATEQYEDLTSTPLVNAYWSRHTSYEIEEIREMQREALVTLGGNIAVFPQPDSGSDTILKELHSFPVIRDLPNRDTNAGDALSQPHSIPPGLSEKERMPNFSRMSADEHLRIFEDIGRGLNGSIESEDSSTDGDGKAVAWWMPSRF